MRTVPFLLLSGGIALLARATAPPDVPFEIEGRVESIVLPSLQRSGTITVGTVVIEFDATTPIESPTARLQFPQLLGTPLPGRSVPGFLDGTAIVTGSSGAGGRVRAASIRIEPSENLLAGEVRASAGRAFAILRTPVELLDDPRMPGRAVDEFGFEIDPTTAPNGSFAAAEGYFGDDGLFHAHSLTADGAVVGPADQTSILRAIQGGTELDVRGASTIPSGVITLRCDDGSTATTTITPDADQPSFGVWRVKFTVVGMPASVIAQSSNGSSATAAVE